ncbi:hypothetical protein DABAL43B_1562 [Psychrobacter sp. DAB_AL43B]|nr:hypothetical protein DABAL43B_1562 [Psychrobacter sp. DAB_AL43B]
MITSLKEEQSIKCSRHKLFNVTTNLSYNKPVYPNLLDQKFDANLPNEA